MKELLYKNKYLIIMFLIIYLLIFGICSCNMFAQDEYNYSNIAWTSDRIDSFSDLLTSVKRIYFNWSGRIPALGMSQLFLYLGTSIYDIINPLLFIIYIILISKIISNKIDILPISIISLLVIAIVPKFWEKFIWLTGSLNYLWPVTFMLIVMYYFYNIIIKKINLSKKDITVLLITSFFAGWSHENTAFVLGSFIIIMCLINYKKIFKFEKSKLYTIIAAVILFGIGAILLIFSPGNFARLGTGAKQINVIYILKNIFQIKYVILFYLLTIIGMLINKKYRDNNKKTLVNQLIYFIFPALAAFLPMLIIPEFPTRAMLAYETCIYICIASNIFSLKEQYKENKAIIKVGTYSIIIVTIIILGYKTWYSYKYIKPYKEKINLQIEHAKLHGERDLVLSAFEDLDRAKKIGVYIDIFPKLLDISINNTYMANYYNVNSITAVKDGYIIIEIILENEKEIINYNAIDKESKNILVSRISSCFLMMPNQNMKNRVVFEVSKDKLKDIIIDVPEDKIKKILLKDITGIKEIDVKSFVR